MINELGSRNLALCDQVKKMNPPFSKISFSSKILTFFLQNLKADGIYTLIALQIVGTVEGSTQMAEKTRISKIHQTSKIRRVSREDLFKHRESHFFSGAFSA